MKKYRHTKYRDKILMIPPLEQYQNVEHNISISLLFRSSFDADLYADIEDFVPILCRFLHKKVVINSSDFFCVPYLKKKVFFNIGFFAFYCSLQKHR